MEDRLAIIVGFFEGQVKQEEPYRNQLLFDYFLTLLWKSLTSFLWRDVV